MQDIFLLKFLNAKNRKKSVKIASGTLVNSKVVKKLRTPLVIPKNKNINAGKQQSVDNSAVKTAPIITKFDFFIKFLEIYMYIQKF